MRTSTNFFCFSRLIFSLAECAKSNSVGGGTPILDLVVFVFLRSFDMYEGS